MSWKRIKPIYNYDKIFQIPHNVLKAKSNLRENPCTVQSPISTLQSTLSDAIISLSLSLYPQPPLLVTLSDSDVATAHIYT